MGELSVILHKAIYEKYPDLKVYKKFIDNLLDVLLKIDKDKTFY
jgi:hypothetical protein